MDEKLLEALKENVMKWEEAANSIDYWMPKVAESDRVELAERGRHYQRNARQLREVIEQCGLSIAQTNTGGE